ncbi:hypothetical protein V1478_016272 [Vespula squamosa]|uniref:Uncharacterized protein n=1 Tax=Vespula squamosa TaxID=30214 RepID=A0ABD1ZZB5_VESSQ
MTKSMEIGSHERGWLVLLSQLRRDGNLPDSIMGKAIRGLVYGTDLVRSDSEGVVYTPPSCEHAINALCEKFNVLARTVTSSRHNYDDDDDDYDDDDDGDGDGDGGWWQRHSSVGNADNGSKTSMEN